MMKKIFSKIQPLFGITVVIPTLLSTIYFSFIASDIYTSESSFVVRSAKNQSSLSGFGALLQGMGFARSQDDTYTVQAFMSSRQAVTQLEQSLPIREYYEDNGDICSRFNLLGINDSKEAFFHYFMKKQVISLNQQSGIATLAVRAFSPSHAQQINQAQLAQAETLINQLNERARKDTIRFAEKTVTEAEKRVHEATNALTEYKMNNDIIDLESQSVTQMSRISQLQNELIATQGQLNQIQSISPNNPQVNTLKARERNLRKEINAQMQLVLGGENSLTGQAADYQRLMLENTLAQQQLTTALTTLENARQESERQQLYLEVINPPSHPDLALLPKRLYNIVSVFIIGLMLYGILSLLIASIREHKN